MKKVLSILLIIACIVYLINPTLGVFELIPDNLPIVGNIDEVFVAGLLLSLINFLRTGEFRLINQNKKRSS
jgi:uncharacterized membrane protein YkvA (DUF1232 family)